MGRGRQDRRHTQTIDITTKKAPAKKHVLVNTYDERLDAPLPESDSKAFARFADRIKAHGKMCNNFHLTGKCESGEYCDYHHGERLTPGEQLVLKHKARSLCCSQKTSCRDAGCFLGHHCKYGSGCYLEWCRFSETHGRDLVSTIPLCGSREMSMKLTYRVGAG